eukprot:1152252-Pelagomonas_calceolata.AAC.1
MGILEALSNIYLNTSSLPMPLNDLMTHVQINRTHPYQQDTRPGRQLEAAQQQHADLCKNINGKATGNTDSGLSAGAGAAEVAVQFPTQFYERQQLARKHAKTRTTH